MRPWRSGSSSGRRPFSAARTSSTASRRFAGAFQPACDSRGHLARSAFPAAYRSAHVRPRSFGDVIGLLLRLMAEPQKWPLATTPPGSGSRRLVCAQRPAGCPPDLARPLDQAPSLPWRTRSRNAPREDRPRARSRRESGGRTPSAGGPRAPPGTPTSRRARRPAPGPAPRRCGRRRSRAGPAPALESVRKTSSTSARRSGAGRIVSVPTIMPVVVLLDSCRGRSRRGDPANSLAGRAQGPFRGLASRTIRGGKDRGRSRGRYLVPSFVVRRRSRAPTPSRLSRPGGRMPSFFMRL